MDGGVELAKAGGDVTAAFAVNAWMVLGTTEKAGKPRPFTHPGNFGNFSSGWFFFQSV